MKFIKDNWTVLVIAVLLISSWAGGGVGYQYLSELNEKLQLKIDKRDAQIDSLDAQIEDKINIIQDSHKREKSLLDSLKLSQEKQQQIINHYENLYHDIRNSSDSEYLEYLRSRRVPDIDRD